MRETRNIDAPQPGYWAMTLCKGGPDVSACIERRSTGFLIAKINGEVVTLSDVWEWRGRPITKEQFERMPIIASPRERVDLEKLPIPFGKE